MKVKELFTDESKWIKGCIARDTDGHQVMYNSNTATSFCLVGAIAHCYSSVEEIREIINLIGKELGGISLVSWNNLPERRFEEVKNLVEKLDI